MIERIGNDINKPLVFQKKHLNYGIEQNFWLIFFLRMRKLLRVIFAYTGRETNPKQHRRSNRFTMPFPVAEPLNIDHEKICGRSPH